MAHIYKPCINQIGAKWSKVVEFLDRSAAYSTLKAWEILHGGLVILEIPYGGNKKF